MTKKMTYGEGQAVNVHEKAADVHTEAGRANVRDLFTPAFWRSFAALSLVLSVSSFMNVSVFPFFDGVFTYARDISITANAAVPCSDRFACNVPACAFARAGVERGRPLPLWRQVAPFRWRWGWEARRCWC